MSFFSVVVFLVAFLSISIEIDLFRSMVLFGLSIIILINN